MQSAFWCPICKEQKGADVASLQIGSRDGSTLHTVCKVHVPADHHEDHESTHPNAEGNPETVNLNADGVVRTLVFEDLLG